MFYSHELLHSRKYGVATIWLVATLGSKSNLKKVTRKAILDVDIPKACDTITDPEAPLALRLQASLLYGVSRVHSQQCNYVLNDTQSFRDKMRGVAQVMKDLETDPDVGRTRPEQLNLLDDAAFIPELDLMFDLSAFGLPSDSTSSRASSLLSTFSGNSSQTSHHLDEEDELALDIPSIDTPGGFGSIHLPAGSSVAEPSVPKLEHLALEHEESAIINDPDFDIAEDGSLVAPAKIRRSEVSSIAPMSETGFSARVGAEHAAGMAAQQNNPPEDKDDGMIIYGDDDDSRLPPAEPFPPRVGSDIAPPSDLPGPISPAMPHPAIDSTESAAAPQRRARGPRQAQMDQRTELQNKDLGDWSNNYLDNMADLARTKEQYRSTAQARKNAAFWILGQGIGRVQANFGEDREPHPLSVFSGQTLLDALIGPQAQHSPTGSKRARSSSRESDGGRRVRRRKEDVQDEVARGVEREGQVLGFDDEGIIVQGDDFNPESEVGRRGGSSIPDVASILPWNRSSANNSRYGSAQAFAGTGGDHGVSSSVGGVASGGIGGLRGTGVITSSGNPRGRHGSMFGGRRSRMLSASPLVGKSRPRLPSVDIEDLMEVADMQRLDSSEAGAAGNHWAPIMDIHDLNAIRGSDDDFEHYGPAADVDTQTAQMSQWMRKTLEDEALNFLGFVENVLSGGDGKDIDPDTDNESQTDSRHEAQQQHRHCEKRDEISMDELLPPEQNSAVVGAQALLHVLALVTKGFMRVKQDEPFGEIFLSVVNDGVVRVGVDADAGADADVGQGEMDVRAVQEQSDEGRVDLGAMSLEDDIAEGGHGGAEDQEDEDDSDGDESDVDDENEDEDAEHEEF